MVPVCWKIAWRFGREAFDSVELLHGFQSNFPNFTSPKEPPRNPKGTSKMLKAQIRTNPDKKWPTISVLIFKSSARPARQADGELTKVRHSARILSTNLNYCEYENFLRSPVSAPANTCRSFWTRRLFPCRIFLGCCPSCCCQIEFNWDFRMSYLPWVSDNLKSTVKVVREGSMSISDRKSKEADWLSCFDK